MIWWLIYVYMKYKKVCKILHKMLEKILYEIDIKIYMRER